MGGTQGAVGGLERRSGQRRSLGTLRSGSPTTGGKNKGVRNLIRLLKSVTLREHAPADFSQPTDWHGSWNYPQMRHEVTVNNTGSFNANVTIGFSLLGGLSVDPSYSENYTTVVTDLYRTDWEYWETSAEEGNTYNELGHLESVATTTTTFSGNLTDGFDADLTEAWSSTGDINPVGTKRTGPSPEFEDQNDSVFTTILDGVQLALDIGGLVPGLGEPLDAINAGISLGRGNFGDAAMSLAAMVPLAGVAATGAKLAGKAGRAIVKNLDKADEAANGLSKMGNGFNDAVKQYNNAAPNVPKITPPCKPSSGCFVGETTVLELDESASDGRLLGALVVLTMGVCGFQLLSPRANTVGGKHRSRRRRRQFDPLL